MSDNSEGADSLGAWVHIKRQRSRMSASLFSRNLHEKACSRARTDHAATHQACACRECSALKLHQRLANSLQSPPQVVRRQAVGDPQVMIHTKVIAWNNQHTLIVHDPLCQFSGVDVQVIARKSNGRCLRRYQIEQAFVALQPSIQYRKTPPDVVPSPFDDARTHLRLQGDGSLFVGQHGGANGRVLVACPNVVHSVGRSDHPADTQPGQAVGLA